MKGKNPMNVEVEVRDLPEMHVAYVRHVGPYKGDTQLFERLFGQLMQWAGPRGLMRPPETKLLSVYHDDPNITEEAKLRVSVCMTVPEDTAVEGEIGKMTIPGGKYAAAHFELLPDQYPKAWNAIFQGWLPQSGYEPDDKPCFELYLNDPKEHPENKCVVDICVPVRPM
jgi:AraC family transcriptional regulator